MFRIKWTEDRKVLIEFNNLYVIDDFNKTWFTEMMKIETRLEGKGT